ncbi:MAG: hypothetical protein H6686_11400 [Fibrobacteria bacterium]|nr:hypothetical protein [Fibrobacteria bacterium]
MSDVYNDDVDKVVTFDSPHKGSWVAHYNKGGMNDPGASLVSDGAKIVTGLSLLSAQNPGWNLPGMLLLLSGGAGWTSATFENFGGWIGNRFQGDEPANAYLTPYTEIGDRSDGDLKVLNEKREMPCERDGCRPPVFVRYGVDGVLAPDNPDKILGNSGLSYVAPTEMLAMMQAGIMAFERDWPEELGVGRRMYLAWMAELYAQGGWNYTQHGSLMVPRNSSTGSGVPFLDRSDVSPRSPRVWGQDGSLGWELLGSAGDISSLLGGTLLTFDALDALSMADPITGKSLALTKLAAGAGLIGLGASIDFGLYSLAYASSHNLTVWESANNSVPIEIPRANGSTVTRSVKRIEDDLYEAPFVQIVSSEATPKGDGSPTDGKNSKVRLHLNSGGTFEPLLPEAEGVVIDLEDIDPIEYSRPGWEERWGVRTETQVPDHQGAGTTIRKVVRRSLPLELLTTRDILSMDLQIDDLRPDLMEQMSISVNWGLQGVVWDRQEDGTYAVTVLRNGQIDGNRPVRRGVPNPVDAFGRWHVDLSEWLSRPILRDGQNLLAISTVNHVGKASVQRQYITWQATPPVLDLAFPQPWEVVSNPSLLVDARASFLSYTRMQFDPTKTGWKLEEGDPLLRAPSEQGYQGISGLESSGGTFRLLQSAGGGQNLQEGPMSLSFRLGTHLVTNPSAVTVSYRRIPFLLDRSPPRLSLGPLDPVPESGQDFMIPLHWNDLPAEAEGSLQLVRGLVRDASGAPVRWLDPLPVAHGGRAILTWDSRDHRGDLVSDGVYRIEVEAMDLAIPDAPTRDRVRALRSELREKRSWGASARAEWQDLRSRADLNWSSVSAELVVDRTPPELELDPLPVRPVAEMTLFQATGSLRDRGAVRMGKPIQLRVLFQPDGPSVQPIHEVSGAFLPGGGSNPQEDRFVLGEQSAGGGRLPDGSWRVSMIAQDANGNSVRKDLEGVLVVDREPPTVSSVMTDHLVVSSRSIPDGRVVLVSPDASMVAGVWTDPNGREVSAEMIRSGKVWTTSYPVGLGEVSGAWTWTGVLRDPAGNPTRTSTVLWVDRTPPKLRVLDAQVSGPIVLMGVAADVDVDNHPFQSYQLDWRRSGEESWRNEGMRVGAGRGPTDQPSLSTRAQVVEGVLGTWDPPVGVTGEVELRVRVDDGSGNLPGREASTRVYVSTPQDGGFTVRTASLDARPGVSSPIGFDIESSARTAHGYGAMVTLEDSRGRILFGKDLVDLKASRFDGKPVDVVDGALQVWREDAWHVRTRGVCRNLTLHIQTRSEEDLVLHCPDSWKCTQSQTAPFEMQGEGGMLAVNRVVEVRIPQNVAGELAMELSSPAQLVVQGDPGAAACANTASSCPDLDLPSVSESSWPLAYPGEITTGRSSLPECGLPGPMRLDPGKESWAGVWDGFRMDGTWPSGGEVRMEVVAWDAITGQVVRGGTSAELEEAKAVLHAWGDAEIGVSEDAPEIQKAARLHFSLEGREADLELRILQGEEVVRRLEGDGSRFEGRSPSRPYTVSWDGRGWDGSLVPPGEYRFEVRERDGDAWAQVPVRVTGENWVEDVGIRPRLPESQWNEELESWLVRPQPWLSVSTGLEADVSPSGPFPYEAVWSAQQRVTMFPRRRFSLMLNRRRETVKFGILYRGIFRLNAYDSDHQKWTSCGGRTDPEAEVIYDPEIHVVEIERGQTVPVGVNFYAPQQDAETTYRFKREGQRIEYLVVPLSQVEDLLHQRNSLRRWEMAGERSLASGKFIIDQKPILEITKIHHFGRSGSSRTSTRVEFKGWESSVVARFGLAGPSMTGKLLTWFEAPPPLTCPEVLSVFGDATHQGIQAWRPEVGNPCGLAASASSDQVEAVNPHRNLFRWRIGDGAGATNLLPRTTGTPDADCAGDDKANTYTFRMELQVPESYWEPAPGVNNLANRFLRLDSENRFLFGSSGYLQGVDPERWKKADGHLSPFETFEWSWRPRLSDLMPSVETGMSWDDRDGTDLEDPSFPAAEMADKDPLYFFEGDHGHRREVLSAWFENSPEQGASRFEAVLTQAGVDRLVRSDEHFGSHHRIEVPLLRGEGSGTRIQGVRDWRPFDLHVQVSQMGSPDDVLGSSPSLDLPWPILEGDIEAVAAEAERRCSERLVDPSLSGCRLHPAASGLRLGIGDGLEASLPSYASSAQQAFFEGMRGGELVDPDALPGRLPGGDVLRLEGHLEETPDGISQFVDADHFRKPALPAAEWGALIEPTVAPRLPAGSPVSVALDGSGIATFLGIAQERWSLGEDPWMAGKTTLSAPLPWSGTTQRVDVSLWNLYQASVSPSGGPGEFSLYQPMETGIQRNPRLRRVRVVGAKVLWRNGEDAQDAFGVESRTDPGKDLTELRVVRKGGIKTVPEWSPLVGYVPAGAEYSIGWTESDGSAWVELDGRLSTCETIREAAADCPLGMVDFSRLPDRGRIGVLIHGEAPRYSLIPFRQGAVVPPGSPTVVSSTFGEASVVFGSGSLHESGIDLRAIRVRTFSPRDLDLGVIGGLRAIGPVVEATPSQRFSVQESLQPWVVVRLSKADLDPRQDLTSLSIHKIDPSTGILSTLPTQIRTLCEGVPCLEGFDVLELSAPTPSFSWFAVLPGGSSDSVPWSFSVDVARSSAPTRRVFVRGCSIEDLRWEIRERSSAPGGASNRRTIVPTLNLEEGWVFSLPEGVWDLVGIPVQGGREQALEIERFPGEFDLAYTGPGALVVGTVNGSLEIPYRSSRSGMLRLAIGEGSAAGFPSGLMSRGDHALQLEGPLLGRRWSGRLRTSLVGVSSDGWTQTVQGPFLEGDASLPWLQEDLFTVREDGDSLDVELRMRAGDEEGDLRLLRLELRTSSGRRIASSEGMDGFVSLKVRVGKDVRDSQGLVLEGRAVDLGGNHVEHLRILDAKPHRLPQKIWVEAETLATPEQIVSVCRASGFAAIATDIVPFLGWRIPSDAGDVLVGRWRSAIPETLTVVRNGWDTTRVPIPARPSWGAVERIARLRTLPGDSLTFLFGPGGLWDGLGWVDPTEDLEVWNPLLHVESGPVQVWARDEDPNDPNMVHLRLKVMFPEGVPDKGYRVRIEGMDLPGAIPPRVESWWPQDLRTSWSRIGPSSWTLEVDRTGGRRPKMPGTVDELVFGLHRTGFAPWRTIAPHLRGGILSSGQEVPVPWIHVFDDSGKLLSSGVCNDEIPWVDPSRQNLTPFELGGPGDVLVSEQWRRIDFSSSAGWAWTHLVVGFTPLDGMSLEGVELRSSGGTEDLGSWWQEIRLDKEGPDPLSLEVRSTIPRRIQIQFWEQ